MNLSTLKQKYPHTYQVVNVLYLDSGGCNDLFTDKGEQTVVCQYDFDGIEAMLAKPEYNNPLYDDFDIISGGNASIPLPCDIDVWAMLIALCDEF
jgi:hypothetical protein